MLDRKSESMDNGVQIRSEVKGDRRWVWGFALIVLALTTLPYLLGYALQGDVWRFTGFIINVEDGNSYIGKMLRGSAGDWLFRTPYTAAAQRGVMIFSPYLILGKLAAPPGLHDQLVALYHLFRIGAGMLMILATYDFLALFIREKWNRRIALVLAILGGGLGWILILMGKSGWLGSMPLEYYSPETFGFLSIFGVPHLAMGRAFMLWGLAIFLDSSRDALSPSKGILSGLCWLVAGIAQPLAPAIGLAVVGCYLAVSRIILYLKRTGATSAERTRWLRTLKLACIALLIPLPLLLYNAWIFMTDSFVQLWASQNIILSPNPFHYALAYGVVIPFAVLGARYTWKNDQWKGWFLVTWVLLLPVLAYIPLNLQRRLPDGIWAALIALTFTGVESIDLSVLQKRLGSAVLCLLILPSTFILFAGGIIEGTNPGLPAFRHVDEVGVFGYLAREAVPDSVVLTSFRTGNALPAWAPLRVVIGHGPESVHLKSLEPGVIEFFRSNECEADCRSFLQENQVRYVVWGPEERALGESNPGKMSLTRLIYQQGEYLAYEILTPE
jgi:hypothetical protein